MKKLITALFILMVMGVSAQDTIYLNGTTKVNFNLGKTVKLWYAGCTEYTAATTERSVTGFGKVQIKTDGVGYVTPVAGAKATFKYYNRNCDVLTPYTVTFMTKVAVTPPDTITPPPNEGGGGGSGTTVTIMPVGDSNTEGYPVLNPAYNSYRKRLDSLMGTKYDFIGRKATGNFTDNQHEGHSGFDLGMLTYDEVKFGGMFTTNRPGVITLIAGTNDVNGFNGFSPSNDPIATAPARMDLLVSEMQAKSPNSFIVVFSIPPIYTNTMGHGTVAKCVTYNTAVAQLVQTRAAAGQKIAFVDIFSNFGPSDYSDGLHLTPAGYAKLADLVYTALRGLGYN